MHDDLIYYLKQLSEAFAPPMCPLERFILECGTDYAGAKRPRGYRKQPDKMCFRNAARLVLRDDDLDYVEGFAYAGIIPCFHAWCIKDDKVLDVTWRKPEQAVYRGVVIPRDLLFKQLSKNRVYGVLDHGLIDLKLIEQLRQQLRREL